MKSIHQIFSVFLIVSVFASNNAYGQSKNKADVNALKKTLYAFAKAYSNLPTTKSKKDILKHVADNLTSTNIVARINGVTSTDHGNFGTFSSYLNKIIRTENFKVVYEVLDIVKVHLRGTNAVVVYEVKYEFAKGGTVWSKGKETVSMLFHKYGTKWKIQHFTFFNLEDQKFKGACLCEVFSAPTGDYVAKTTVPTGKSYTTSLTNYIFKGDSRLDRKIIVDDYKFRWKANGEIIAESAPPKGVNLKNKHLGNANSKGKAVMLILKEFLFKHNCSKFVNKK